MSLEQNLANASAAVNHARNVITSSSNKISDRIARGGGIDAIISARIGTDKTLINEVNQERSKVRMNLTTDWSKNIPTIANHAQTSGIGNCMELAAIAFQYLDQQQVRPIDYMYFTNTKEKYDHAWVVVGRSSRGDPADLRSWGGDAVWCDPWQGDKGKVFSIQDFIKGKVKNLNSIYKCNTVELVQKGKPGTLHRVE